MVWVNELFFYCRLQTTSISKDFKMWHVKQLPTWSKVFLYSVGCLWHSHGKNPVRLYPKLQSQPIGLPKIFIDYLFFQADQLGCTKSVSIFNRFASSEERSLPNLSPLSFATRGLGWLVNQRNPSGYWQVTKGDLSQIHDSFLFRSSFFIRF